MADNTAVEIESRADHGTVNNVRGLLLNLATVLGIALLLSAAAVAVLSAVEYLTATP